jgi:predicted Fe-S protein YdhL (DUF1289 family)
MDDTALRRPCRRNAFTDWDDAKVLAMTTYFRAVLSPCIGVCSLSEDGLCHGCHRSGAEIARWSQMSDDERLHLMEAVLPERESRRG